MAVKYLRPEDLAKKGVALLKEKADPERARRAQHYFKEKVHFLGLTSPQMRDIAKELYRLIKTTWTPSDAVRLCEILLPNPYYEARALSILILTRYKKALGKDVFDKIHGWLNRNFLDNWAMTDITCPDLLGTLLEKNPELIESLRTWASSPNRWVRRASIVSFIKLAKKREFLNAIYEMAESHFDDKDDLIHKANGWLLREAGKSDMIRLERFLLEHGSRIPRTTLRYAIERFEEKKRKALLEKTRPRT